MSGTPGRAPVRASDRDLRWKPIYFDSHSEPKYRDALSAVAGVPDRDYLFERLGHELFYCYMARLPEFGSGSKSACIQHGEARAAKSCATESFFRQKPQNAHLTGKKQRTHVPQPEGSRNLETLYTAASEILKLIAMGRKKAHRTVNRAARVAADLRDDITEHKAELREQARQRMQRKTNTGAAIGQFVAGVTIGFAGWMLFAPWSGGHVRSRASAVAGELANGFREGYAKASQ